MTVDDEIASPVVMMKNDGDGSGDGSADERLAQIR